MMNDFRAWMLRVVIGCPRLRRKKSLESYFDKLSDDLFVEILQRLPLKLIHLCKCVSKRWYGFISTPHFARCYAHNCSSLVPPFALFHQFQYPACGVRSIAEEPIFESRGFDLDFLVAPPSNEHQTEASRYLAPSNGLVLSSATLNFPRVYYVCNPLTRHWVELPPPPTCQEKVNSGFVCKPCYSFDGTTCTTSFRVVRLIHQFEPPQNPPPGSATLKLEIFSSDTCKWTETIISIRGHKFIESHCHSNAVVCNGILHWMNLYRGKIFPYDPFNNTDQFRTIREPKDISVKEACEHLLGVPRTTQVQSILY
ncbi:F-box protein At1g49990-like [Cornus florida]|uniref:F-box protein At1g49990-like n=1 Tax=Cornus florida TaxID=4283 RepID=UPI0028A27C5C|nr:F-box protein At1g49990-like [Cornus florida]